MFLLFLVNDRAGIYYIAQQGLRLNESIISSLSGVRSLECAHRCFRLNGGCSGFNYKKTDATKCELTTLAYKDAAAEQIETNGEYNRYEYKGN